MNIHRWIISAAFVASLAQVVCLSAAHAQNIPDITPAEFASWPEYCQARHVTVPPGDSSPYVLTFPKSKIRAAEQELGQATFVRVHHYCRGLIWLNRARTETDPALKAHYLQWAESEVIYTYKGLPPNSPMIAPTFLALSQICSARGDYKCALNNLHKAIDLRPSDPSAYSALAILYEKQHKPKLAKEVLLKGDRALDGKSPEIDYNLGLIYLELGDVDSAVKRAHKAYSFGYPLPGLMYKLKRLGKWEQAPPKTGDRR